MKPRSGLLLLLSGALALAAPLPSAVHAKDTVKLAFIGPLSGGNSAPGLGGRNSAQLAVQLRNPSGTVLATLANYSNLSPKFPYAQASFDLSSYKGQTVQVYLVGNEDQGLQTSFIIDDFSLDVTQ